MELKTAKVISLEDETQSGKVQVRIMPELNGVPEEDLPWAEPYHFGGSGSSAETGVHNPPEKDSFIKVVVEDKFWKKVKYLADEYIEGFYVYQKWADEVDISTDDLPAQEYPQPRFQRTKSGVVKFENTETGDTGMYHPSGTYVIMDAEGNLKVKYGATVKVYNDSVTFEMMDDGTVKVTADTAVIDGKLQVGEGGDNIALFAPLEEVLSVLLEHTHTAPSGPTLPPLDSTQAPLTKYKQKVQQIKSEVSASD